MSRSRSRSPRTGARQKDGAETSLVVLTDPGQDLDDEMSFLMAKYLHMNGLVEVLGVVTTLCPQEDRARLARGTFNQLGFGYEVRVGVGSHGGDIKGVHKASMFENAAAYMNTTSVYPSPSLEHGQAMLLDIYQKAEPKSVTFLIIASLRDAALFVAANGNLFQDKTKEVVIMGGVKTPLPEDGETFLQPNDAHNNEFDKSLEFPSLRSDEPLYAAQCVLQACQVYGVPLVVLSRFTSYKVQMPRGVYDELASLSILGKRYQASQSLSIEALWIRASAPEGSKERAGLPARCDRKWFINTFCAGIDDGTESPNSVWHLVKSFNQYDTLALIASVPSLRGKFFDPAVVTVNGIAHSVIGVDADHPNLKGDEGIAGLKHLMNTGFIEVLQ